MLRIISKLRPDLESLSGIDRAGGIFDLAGVLCGAPLVPVGLVWLIAATDLALMRAEWATLCLVFILLSAFERLEFFLVTEVRPGIHYDWSDTFVTTVTWSAALMFGPSALWLLLIGGLIKYGSNFRRSSSIRARWNTARNFVLQFLTLILGGLIALALYRQWGGAFPMPGLTLEAVRPALGATLVWCLLSALVWGPALAYFGSPLALGPSRTGWSLGAVTGWWASLVGWRFLVDPFAILAAGLYAQNGLGGYLFFVAGLLLASALAHQLSQAVEHRRQRSRELERLEQLGRAILGARPDASNLPGILTEHLSSMFPHCQIDIHVFPDQTLVHSPADGPPVDGSAWEWLHTASEAHTFPPGAVPPWTSQAVSDTVLVAPILDAEGTHSIGGIHLRRTRAQKGVEVGSPTAIQTVASQIASALRRADIYRQTLAHQRIEQELALAGRIQTSLLPRELPDIAGWQIAAALKPAKETAGDFYDVIPLPNSRLAIVVADVADKGMGAALYMALCRTLIRTYAVEYHARPDLVMTVTNRRILTDTDVTMFVTVFYGVLDPATGQLAYCNAGHNPPYLLSKWRTMQTLEGTGTALGVMERETWEQRVVQIAPGDRLLLYTDGVTEAQDAQGTLFGEHRLVETAQAAMAYRAQEMQDAVLAAVDRFAGNVPQFDDITLMVVAREP